MNVDDTIIQQFFRVHVSSFNLNALPVPSKHRFMKRCVFARRQRTSATSPRARCLEYGLVFANFVRRQRVFGTSRRVAKMARANFCATSTRFGHLFTHFCCLFLFRFPFLPKMAPRSPKMAPRRPQDGPKRPQDGPKRAQDGPKRPQDGPKVGPKTIKLLRRNA